MTTPPSLPPSLPLPHATCSSTRSAVGRMGAVVSAQRAVVAGEIGAAYALRQGLIDLAAAAELLAEELPALSFRLAERNVALPCGAHQMWYICAPAERASCCTTSA